jgi:hypothetical protein
MIRTIDCRHDRIRTGAAGLAGLAVLVAAGACSGPGADPEANETVAGAEAADAATLLEMVNEGYRLDKELSAAEDRIIAECLEAQGFTVHDKRYMGQYEPVESDSLAEFYPAGEFLPEADVAAKWGFGWWAQTAEMFESEETQLYYEELWGFEDDDEPVFDNAEFESLSDDDRRAWSVAYQGEEATAALEYDGGAPEDDTSTGDGSLEFGDSGVQAGPEPGGCQAEMITALYGEAELVPIDGDAEFMDWRWRPEMPVIDLDAVEAEYAVRMADAEGAFLSCLADGGFPGWEFDERGVLAMLDYSSLLYTGEVASDEDLAADMGVEPDPAPPVPDLPEDVPDDFEGKRAFEIQMAQVFAACGDDSGYRAAATSTYDTVLVERYTAIETDTYAWQDEMRAAITAAQDLIAG